MDQKCIVEAELFKIASIIPAFMKNMAEEGFEFKLKTKEDDEIAGEILSEVVKALEATNAYFIKIQNRVALTPMDENTWSKVARCLKLVKEFRDAPKEKQ